MLDLALAGSDKPSLSEKDQNVKLVFLLPTAPFALSVAL
jgi:hypothetical protein